MEKAHGKDGVIQKYMNSQCYKFCVAWSDYQRNVSENTKRNLKDKICNIK